MTQPVKNPYNKDLAEAQYLTWEHGYNSSKPEDNPYDKADEPDLYKVWSAGYRANKSRKAAAVASEGVEGSELPVEGNVDPSALGAVSTELLELELKKRKLKELHSLNQQASQLEKQLNEVNLKITRLNVLLGE